MINYEKIKIKDVALINEVSINRAYQFQHIEYIDIASVNYGTIDNIQELDLKEAPSRAKRIIRDKDILLSTVRPNLKHYAIIKKSKPNTIGSTGFAVISCKKIHHYYLFYYLTTEWFTNYLSAIADNQQAAYPAFNPSVIEEADISVPPLPIQKKIAAVLSAYDDLIENNNRRIAILEKMAEEIYREWFVRMRFPGHEQVKFYKGVPEGWEGKRIGELVDTQYGYTASGEEKEVGPKLLRITDIVPNMIAWDRVPHCIIDNSEIEKYLLQEGDILVARTGATVGYAKRINKLHPKSIFASFLVRLKPKKFTDNIFLGIAVDSDTFKQFINSFLTGAAQPQANAQIMKLFLLLYPNIELILKFNKVIEPFLDLKEKLYLENNKLIQTRNNLLPRLITGKLSIEDLDIKFPSSMEEEDA